MELVMIFAGMATICFGLAISGVIAEKRGYNTGALAGMRPLLRLDSVRWLLQVYCSFNGAYIVPHFLFLIFIKKYVIIYIQG